MLWKSLLSSDDFSRYRSSKKVILGRQVISHMLKYTSITIYKKKSNKYQLKESYDCLSGKITKSLFLLDTLYIYIVWIVLVMIPAKVLGSNLRKLWFSVESIVGVSTRKNFKTKLFCSSPFLSINIYSFTISSCPQELLCLVFRNRNYNCYKVFIFMLFLFYFSISYKHLEIYRIQQNGLIFDANKELESVYEKEWIKCVKH